MNHMLSQFIYDQKGKSLATEASSLGYKAGQIPGGRLYQDSCDFGIKIESNATGRVLTFLLDERRSNESLFLYVPFNPNDQKIIKEVCIFND